jgi:hypothetical protein
VIIENETVWCRSMNGRRFSRRGAEQLVAAVRRAEDLLNEAQGAWERTEAVAFTAGSYWFCLGCCGRIAQAEVVYAAQLLDEYSYACDQCSTVIRRSGS